MMANIMISGDTSLNGLSLRIRNLPKVELHRHLDCSVRFSTLVELAPQVGIEIPKSIEQIQDHFLILTPMKDLEAVLNKFLRAQKVLASSEILERIAFEACEDAFNDGIRLIEFRYAPTFIADGHPHLQFSKIHKALTRGLERAEAQLPIVTGLICIFQRVKTIEQNLDVLTFFLNHADSFIAADLADNEEFNPPENFKNIFTEITKKGIPLTIHSGETPHPQSAQWVRGAVEILGARRIGHGVQVINDLKVMDLLRQNKIHLEVCPHSNYLTQAFPDYSSHPLRKLWNAGIHLNINSDDPGIFHTQLSDDYQIAMNHQGFTITDFQRMNQLAFDASFINERKKEKVRGNYFPTN